MMNVYRAIYVVILLMVLCGSIPGCAGTLSQTRDLFTASVAEEKADAAYENKDYAAAFEHYRTAAQAGSPYGQFKLAAMYRDGEGVQRDARQYSYWIQQAAENGSPAAHYVIGLQLIPKNPAAAVRYLEKAAALEHGTSMHLLGLLHAQGIGVPQSTREALRWFRLAHAHGLTVDRRLLTEPGIEAYVKETSRAAAPAVSADRATGRQLVREIQQRLTDLGYAPGPVDGMFGGRTKAAIQAFQRAKGLEPDGQATPQLLEALKSTR